MKASLRTAETEAIYQNKIAEGLLEMGCALCSLPSLKEFQYWRVITNNFPYDRIAEVHHMLVPKRHVSDTELSEEEKKDLESIKATYLNTEYDYLLEATYKQKSIPAHAHLHLLVIKN